MARQTFTGKSRWLIVADTLSLPQAYFSEKSAQNMARSLEDCGHVVSVLQQRLVNGQWVDATHDLSLLYGEVGGEG